MILVAILSAWAFGGAFLLLLPLMVTTARADQRMAFIEGGTATRLTSQRETFYLAA